MNDQTYATPTADLAADSGSIADLLQPLSATKFWVRLCSVLGFFFTFLMLISGVFMILGGSALTGASGAEMPVPIGAVGVVYLLMGVLYLMPSLYLFKYASAISSAESSHSMMDISKALSFQKSFWKFVGILALLMVILMMLGIVSAIVIPMMM